MWMTAKLWVKYSESIDFTDKNKNRDELTSRFFIYRYRIFHQKNLNVYMHISFIATAPLAYTVSQSFPDHSLLKWPRKP